MREARSERAGELIAPRPSTTFVLWFFLLGLDDLLGLADLDVHYGLVLGDVV